MVTSKVRLLATTFYFLDRLLVSIFVKQKNMALVVQKSCKTGGSDIEEKWKPRVNPEKWQEGGLCENGIPPQVTDVLGTKRLTNKEVCVKSGLNRVPIKYTTLSIKQETTQANGESD